MQFIREDKNGTKYYADYKCPRCGGQGGRDEWLFTGFTCYKCGGTGTVDKPIIYKEYTPEYAAKLQARREKLAEKRRAERMAKAEELNANFFKDLGFSADGKAWVVVGNTYEIKDALKENGARYINEIGWHFDHPDNGYDCFMVEACKMYEIYDGLYDFQGFGKGRRFTDEFPEYLQAQKDQHIRKKNESNPSDYVGSVGDKINLEVTFINQASFENYNRKYGMPKYTNVYTFADAEGNVFVWKTANALDKIVNDEYVDIKIGEIVNIKGTIKEHQEYKGLKQTVLTRCKII